VLHEHGERAKVLAGGQSLVPMMNFRLARPAALVDINRVTGLAYVREGPGSVVIGALTRHRELERSPVVRARCPLLAAAVPFIGHAAIRNRGTIGGSLAHADPAAELVAVAAALGARLVVRSVAGERVLTPSEFFVSYLTTALGADELLVEVRLPGVVPRTGSAFVEVSRRHGDFALVAVAAEVTLDDAGRCATARLALSGVGGVPFVATDEVALLLGDTPAGNTLAEVGRRVSAAVTPDGDLHASAEYRKELAAVLVRRALTEAVARAGDPL
jgi:CO/xanthine dehydrogenase FAD-binding subunit